MRCIHRSGAPLPRTQSPDLPRIAHLHGPPAARRRRSRHLSSTQGLDQRRITANELTSMSLNTEALAPSLWRGLALLDLPRAMNKRLPGHSERISIETAGALAAIGNRIRDLRGQKTLTLQALSELTGLSPSMLSLVERGQTTPSIGTLVVISSALGVHMSD